jgi:hypothetical protein
LIARTIAACVLILAAFSLAPAQSEVRKFRYQPKKITTGTVYHYVKTNIDGTHPENVSIYVAARDRIESFKYHPGTERAGLVIAEMDWTIFSAKRLESWQVFGGGEKKLFATLDFLKESMMTEVSIPLTGRPAEKTAIKKLPFHIYNFDLASLNFAFRHLLNPKGKFSIGIADPTFQETGALFHYKGEVEISYVGEESRGGAPCRKYRIDGAGLENRGGYLWVDKREGYFRDLEISLPDNPNWQSFKFRLTDIQQMSLEEWEKFMRSQFAPRPENAG